MPFNHLWASSDVRAVFAARIVERGVSMAVHSRPRHDQGPGRAAVAAGRGLGGAVQRNRAKRRLRAALAASTLPEGTDIVVVARPAALREPFSALRAELDELLVRSVRRMEAGRR